MAHLSCGVVSTGLSVRRRGLYREGVSTAVRWGPDSPGPDYRDGFLARRESESGNLGQVTTTP